MHEELEQDFEEENTHVEHHHGPVHIECAFCKGTGVHPDTMKDINFRPCPSCHGKGIFELKGERGKHSSCSKCGGSGRESSENTREPCHVCGGRGLV